VAIALAASCGHPAAAPPPLAPLPRPPGPPPDACVLGSDSAALPATLAVAVPDVARFVQTQVYETLIRIDCTGAAAPALAQSWTSDDGGHRWTFLLRRDARFSDSTPVTAADVFVALSRDSLLGAAVVTIEGIDRVSVRFPDASETVPRVFADPMLAVSRRTASGGWLAGSGVGTGDTSGGVATVTSLPPGRRPTVTVRAATGGDARDLLDHGIDILVSGEPEVLSYAANRGDLTTVPLPWDRAYVLVSARVPAIGDTLRASLARDVVRTDARPARGLYWWSAGPACPSIHGTLVGDSAAHATASASLYYPRDDAAARNLAERLVALGLVGTDVRAIGVSAADFDILFAAGGASYLIPLEHEALDPCRAIQDLETRAPWLSLVEAPARAVAALVETRAHAIVRRGGTAFTIDWDGTLRLR